MTDADTTCGWNSVNGIVLNYRLQDRLDHTLGLVIAGVVVSPPSQVILDSIVKQGKATFGHLWAFSYNIC